MKKSPTIAVLVEPRQLGSACVRGVCAVLEQAGCRLPIVVAGPAATQHVNGGEANWSAALLFGRDALSLAAATAAEAFGVPVVNPPSAIARTRDPVAAHCTLHRAGLPVEPIWTARGASGLAAVPTEAYPLAVHQVGAPQVLEPRVLERALEASLLPTLHDPRSLYVLQRAPRGPRLEVLVAGGRVLDHGAPVEPRLRDLALRAGAALGLDLFAVELALEPEGPRVLAVSDDPRLPQEPESYRAVAAHVLARLGVEAPSTASVTDLRLVREGGA
jgi:hypothetical protein